MSIIRVSPTLAHDVTVIHQMHQLTGSKPKALRIAPQSIFIADVKLHPINNQHQMLPSPKNRMSI